MGDFKLTVSEVWEMDFGGDADAYYKQIEYGIHKHQVLNKRTEDFTGWQKNLVFAKAAELRQKVLEINQRDVYSMLINVK